MKTIMNIRKYEGLCLFGKTNMDIHGQKCMYIEHKIYGLSRVNLLNSNFKLEWGNHIDK